MERIAFMKSVIFELLRPGNELLVSLAGLAEAVLHIYPGSALTRLRSFAEELGCLMHWFWMRMLRLHGRHQDGQSFVKGMLK